MQVVTDTKLPEDVFQRVKELHRDCFGPLLFSVKRSIPPFYYLFLYKLKGKIIGYAYLHNRRATVHIQRLCIDSTQRGNQHGSTFLKRILGNTIFKQKKIYLSVEKSNDKAIRFYQKHHFTITKENKDTFHMTLT
jgi:ribosomal protein S18 acetylase RimI-like enzyme